METLEDKRKKERRKEADSDGRKEVFWMWRIQPYGQLL